jgi:hypothetical protein
MVSPDWLEGMRHFPVSRRSGGKNQKETGEKMIIK